MAENARFTKTRTAVLAAFFINGALMATWVSRIPAVQSKFQLTEGTLGLLLLAPSGGILLALLFAGGLIAKLGSHRVVLIAALSNSIMLPLIALAPGPFLLGFCLMIFGAGISLMDVAMNEQAVLVERKAGKPMMSSFHAGYSVGSVVGALIGAGMAALPHATIFQHFILVAVCAAVVSYFSTRNLQPVKAEETKKRVVFQLPEQALWVLGAIAFASALGESTSSDWSGVYLKNVLGTDSSTAALGYAAFSAMMTLGRLMGDWLTRKLKPAVIIRVGGITAAMGFVVAGMTSMPWLAISGFALTGFGLANIIPLLYSTAGNLHGSEPGRGIAGVATIGYAGFLLGPPLVGMLADAYSLRVALYVIALIVATLFISGRAVNRRVGK